MFMGKTYTEFQSMLQARLDPRRARSHLAAR